jgi:alkylated DNA repair dioxygenase AlkB
MQQSLFGSEYDSTVIHLNMPDAEVLYYPDFIPAQEANHYLESLRQSLDWRQEKITLYGKAFDVPRLQAWYGDKDSQYQYSNLTMQPNPWTKELKLLKQKCESKTKDTFNSVLENLYRDGNDGMGRHADDEPELGHNPVIASVSLGQTRNLDFYHKHTKQKVRIPLENGSLLLMRGTTQNHWQHALAKTKKVLLPRINLTFRKIYV